MNKDITKSSRWFLMGLLCLSCGTMGSGCGDDDDSGAPAPEEAAPGPQKQKAAEKKAETAAAGDASADEDRLAYSYNPIGKRDPFRSFIAKEIVAPNAQVETPLQRYEIDQYKLVGVIWGMDNPTAMVEDPEGMGHFLQRDTLIGKNWGKVVRITPSEVIVAEEYRDFEGKLIVNEIPLKLPADKDTVR